MGGMFSLIIMLPGEDGLSVLKRLRDHENTKKIPIIMLTAKGTELDKVKGLDLGADDYIAKPFGVLEFISRVRAVLRRSLPKNDIGDKLSLSVGKVNLDDLRHVVQVDGNSVKLTFKEYELLKFLMKHPGIVFSRQQLLEKIWRIGYDMDSRTIDMHVKMLRKKLGEQGSSIIQTVRNVGYRVE